MQSEETGNERGNVFATKKSTLGKLIFPIIGAAMVAAIAFAIYRVRASSLPTMTRADFEAAQTLWEEAEISDYQIEVSVEGMQPGRYEVRVQDDLAIAAKFDGRDLKHRRTFGTWAVNGMFDTLSRDLETNDKENYLLLKAEFHPEYGYPVKYERIEMRTGVHDALQWEVTKFQEN